MKKYLIGFTAMAVVFLASCKQGDDPKPTPIKDADSLLTGEITAARTLKTGNTYYMTGLVYVKGTTLTIEKGVTIKANPGKTALVITRGAKIDAVGTAAEPIVITSNKSSVEYGDWGGVVILGRAMTNTSFSGQAGVGEIEGGINNAAGDGLYGGTDDADNSGKLSFVRIEGGGFPFLPDKELNSLTLGGVGSGTQIDHIQVSKGYDDGFEMFGGTVNLKYIISYKTYDDDFDCDFGYRGKVQFAMAIRDKDQADAQSGSNGFEQDNDGSGTENAPFTAPVFSNVTIIGPKENSSTTFNSNFKRAAHLRRNTRTSIFNSILMGFPTGILIDGSKSASRLIDGTMELKGILIAGASKALDSIGTSSTGLDLTSTFATAGWNNQVLVSNSDAKLTAPYAIGSNFNPAPASGSPALSGATFSSPKLAGFFTTTTYIGASDGSNNWWSGWAKF